MERYKSIKEDIIPNYSIITKGGTQSVVRSILNVNPAPYTTKYKGKFAIFLVQASIRVFKNIIDDFKFKRILNKIKIEKI